MLAQQGAQATQAQDSEAAKEEVVSERIFEPEMNDGHHVFVFGSNLGGYHGAGAAATAFRHWGAVYRVGVGRQGNSWGIPTKGRRLEVLPLRQINEYVQDFLGYAQVHPELTFLVTRIGCGYAGYTDNDIAPMFRDAPHNCVLPDGWRNS